MENNNLHDFGEMPAADKTVLSREQLAEVSGGAFGTDVDFQEGDLIALIKGFSSTNYGFGMITKIWWYQGKAEYCELQELRAARLENDCMLIEEKNRTLSFQPFEVIKKISRLPDTGTYSSAEFKSILQML